MEYEFKEGVMWEDNPWAIVKDCECSENGGQSCKHCHSFITEHHKNVYNQSYTTKKWICPYVIIVQNEGDCNSTGLCLDCVKEAIKTLEV